MTMKRPSLAMICIETTRLSSINTRIHSLYCLNLYPTCICILISPFPVSVEVHPRYELLSLSISSNVNDIGYRALASLVWTYSTGVLGIVIPDQMYPPFSQTAKCPCSSTQNFLQFRLILPHLPFSTFKASGIFLLQSKFLTR